MLSAGGVLRELWDRLLPLRTGVAHVVAVSIMAWAARLDNLAVEVTLPQARGEAFTVDLPAETLAARYIGVLLARLNGSVLEEGGHPLVRAVEARIRGAEVRRAEDGIVLSAVEIEHL